MSVEASKETLEFQTEARQILHLMTHSLYSHKEIFIRELISNASDACDKLRFEALADDSLYEGDSELSILVEYDDDAKTITISDNGIGMTRQEVIDNIRKRTKKFLIFDLISAKTAPYQTSHTYFINNFIFRSKK